MCALIHICSDNVIRLQQTVFPCHFMPFDFCELCWNFVLLTYVYFLPHTSNHSNQLKNCLNQVSSRYHRYNPAICTQGLQFQVIPHMLRIQLKPCLNPVCFCMQKHDILRQVIYCENSFPIVNYTISPLLLFSSFSPKLINEVSRLMRVERLSKKFAWG